MRFTLLDESNVEVTPAVAAWPPHERVWAAAGAAGASVAATTAKAASARIRVREFPITAQESAELGDFYSKNFTHCG